MVKIAIIWKHQCQQLSATRHNSCATLGDYMETSLCVDLV